MYDSEDSLDSVTPRRVGGMGGGKGFKREGTYVHL